MKQTIALVLVLAVFIVSLNATACAFEFPLSAQAYVLYCVENDTLLISHNENEKMKPASTTKIMTTLLALEEAQKNDKLVSFCESMIAEGSSMYLKVSDTVHLSDLCIGMMMASGNDAANAAAISISGDIEKFSELMNNRAKSIGMKNTNFVTPSGLDDEMHYSTAYDMALLMACAIKNEEFAQLTREKSMTVDFLTPQKQVTYTNHNRLLSMYEHCIGGKTGYTKSAGRCLVTAAKKDGLTLVCVTLNASDDWNDHIKMYDYGFEKLCGIDTDDSDERYTIDVVGSDVDKVSLYCDISGNTAVNKEDKDKVKKTVYMPSFVYAPVNVGEYIGMVVYTIDDKVIASNPVFAKESADRIKSKSFWDLF